MAHPAHLDVQVLLLSGTDTLERATIGLAFAVAAAAAGERVVVHLAGLGTEWADRAHGSLQAKGHRPIDEYFELLAEAGARIEGCASCIANLPSTSQLRDGLVVCGLSTCAIRATTVRSLVF